jgi:excisionase family DNA binding protein
LNLEFLSVSETAAELGRSTDFIRDEIDRRRLASHRFGNRIFVARNDLAAYLKRSRAAAFGEKPRKKIKADCTAAL